MAGFQFTDEDDPQPITPAPKPSEAGPPGAAQGAKQAGGPGAAPGGGAPRPAGPAAGAAGRPGGASPGGGPGGGGPNRGAGQGRPPAQVGGGAPGAHNPKGPQQRSAPRYGEGGQVLPPEVQPTPGMAFESSQSEKTEGDGASSIATDKSGQALYEIGQSIKAVMEALETPATWLLRISCVVGALCLAYILAGIFMAKPAQMDAAHLQELSRNLRYASQGFSYALLAAFVSAMILGYEDNRVGIAAVIAGVALHFGAPLALRQIVGNTAMAAGMAAMFRTGGWILLWVGLIKASIDTLAWLVTLPEKVKARADVGFARPAELKQQAIAREANMLSPCWNLPFCREVIRKQCPAYLAKKTCWKFGRGCYCDEEMIGRIIRGEDANVVKAPTRMSRSGKPPCGRCYIFLEHQTHKFRAVSPLALPLAAVATFAVWPIYTRIFTIFSKASDSVWRSLSFNPQKLTPDALKTTTAVDMSQYQADPQQIAQIAMTMLGVLMGFFILIYISKFIEWAIYKAKW